MTYIVVSFYIAKVIFIYPRRKDESIWFVYWVTSSKDQARNMCDSIKHPLILAIHAGKAKKGFGQADYCIILVVSYALVFFCIIYLFKIDPPQNDFKF
jgi:hypothetical protein